MRQMHPVTQAALESDEPVWREVGLGPWAEVYPHRPRPDRRGDPANFDERYDTELIEHGDRRNVLDRYRYLSVEAIKQDLDQRGRHSFDVAVENWTHDFNLGSMVRSANAFGAGRVYIVGPHKWNRRGSLMTELYQHVEHVPTIESLISQWKQEHNPAVDAKYADAKVIAMDIVPGSIPLETYQFPKHCLLLFGAEGPGLSSAALEMADDVVHISQYGSVRSINAGAAAAVSMHAWVAQHGVPMQS